jgi:tetratricopeptide (TPR) repeat protein
MRGLVTLLAFGLIAANAPDPEAVSSTLSPEVRSLQPAADAPFAAMMQLSKADAARAQGDWAAAAAAYRAVLHLDPDQGKAREGLAETLLAMGRADAAYEALSPVSSQDQTHLSLRLRIDLARGHLDQPDEHLREGFAKTRDPRLLNALGRWLDDQGHGEAARKAFQDAAPYQRPGLAETNIGLSFLRQGALRLAQHAFDRAVAADPVDLNFQRHQRLCALMRGDYMSGLEGMSAGEAAPFLRQAGASALSRGDKELARLLLKQAETLSVRHDPKLATLIARLENERPDPSENTD